MRSLIAVTLAAALLTGCESVDDVSPAEVVGGVTLAVVGGFLGAQIGSGAGQAIAAAAGAVVGGVAGVLAGSEVDVLMDDDDGMNQDGKLDPNPK